MWILSKCVCRSDRFGIRLTMKQQTVVVCYWCDVKTVNVTLVYLLYIVQYYSRFITLLLPLNICRYVCYKKNQYFLLAFRKATSFLVRSSFSSYCMPGQCWIWCIHRNMNVSFNHLVELVANLKFYIWRIYFAKTVTGAARGLPINYFAFNAYFTVLQHTYLSFSL